MVAFAFGLLHGLGFASGLATLGLPRNEIPLALLLFNLGVEIGQLAFVAVVIALERAYAVLKCVDALGTACSRVCRRRRRRVLDDRSNRRDAAKF